MFVTNWISTTKIQKISEITNFFRHYFLSRTEVIISTWREQNTKCLVNTAVNGLNSCKHCHNQDLLNSALKSYYTDLILKAYPKKFSKVCTMDKNIIEVLRNNARSLVFNKP